MARLIEIIVAQTGPALVTATNAFLAALVNPTIIGVDFALVRNYMRNGDDYRLVIRYNSAGSVLATPFLIRVDESNVPATAATALQTFMAANPTFFFGDTLLGYIDDGGVKLQKSALLTIYNATAGASANYPVVGALASGAVRPTTNVAQTIPNATITLLEFPTTVFLVGGMAYTYSAGVSSFFTAPVTGAYLLDGAINMESGVWGVGDSLAMYYYINGGFGASPTLKNFADTESNVTWQLRGTAPVNLVAGDQIDLRLQLTAANGLSRSTNANPGLSHFILTQQG